MAQNINPSDLSYSMRKWFCCKCEWHQIQNVKLFRLRHSNSDNRGESVGIFHHRKAMNQNIKVAKSAQIFRKPETNHVIISKRWTENSNQIKLNWYRAFEWVSEWRFNVNAHSIAMKVIFSEHQILSEFATLIPTNSKSAQQVMWAFTTMKCLCLIMIGMVQCGFFE